MESETCVVMATINQVAGALDSGSLTHPPSRQNAEEMLRLLDDISTGRAEHQHFDALILLAEQLEQKALADSTVQIGHELLTFLREHKESFLSHIETRHCPTGDCVRLTPAPCQMACPASIDIPSYVTLIGLGRDAEAIDLIRQDNPFPWVCGLVCTNPCEFMCVRGRIDSPVSIKYLKGFAAERAMSEGRYKNPPKAPDNGRKVCIVGAGPGGLTAAYYLALKGYQVTVIEALPVAGGMMMVGIPRYRLPREVIDREAGMIEMLGVELRYNTRLGKDVTFEQLQEEGFEAFLLAIGAHSALRLMIPGENDYLQVTDAVDFLQRVALGDRHMPGRRVMIIGGGNVAIDAARTSVRLGCEEVTILYRRTRSEMPAHEEEVRQAEEEGVRFRFLTAPIGIAGEGGRLEGVNCLRTALGDPDSQGRRRPVAVKGSDHIHECDSVISAIGQAIDSHGLDHLDLKWSKRGTITVNTVTMQTSIPGLFAAGDVVSGPATVVEAIGGGKRAAEAIDRYLNGIPQPLMPPVPKRRLRLDSIECTAIAKMTLHRSHMPVLNTDRRRITFQQVELGYSEETVRNEARRCLRCDICRRCGQCVDICRNGMKIDALQLGYLDFDRSIPTNFSSTEDRCITCGACAANCPNEAITIRDHDGERILSLCGTVLNHQRLVTCDSCGVAIGSDRYLDFISNRSSNLPPVLGGKRLCADCAREDAAAKFSTHHD